MVEVNEATVSATNRGADWWAMFLLAHRGCGRVTAVDMSVGGGIWHVACDDAAHARQLATAMIEQHGLPRSAVRARVLRDGGVA